MESCPGARSAAPLVAEVWQTRLWDDRRGDRKTGCGGQTRRDFGGRLEHVARWRMPPKAISPARSRLRQSSRVAVSHLDAQVARAALLVDLKVSGRALKDLDYIRGARARRTRAAYLRAVIARRSVATCKPPPGLAEVDLVDSGRARMDCRTRADADARCPWRIMDLAIRLAPRNTSTSWVARYGRNLGHVS